MHLAWKDGVEDSDSPMKVGQSHTHTNTQHMQKLSDLSSHFCKVKACFTCRWNRWHSALMRRMPIYHRQGESCVQMPSSGVKCSKHSPRTLRWHLFLASLWQSFPHGLFQSLRHLQHKEQSWFCPRATLLRWYPHPSCAIFASFQQVVFNERFVT